MKSTHLSLVLSLGLGLLGCGQKGPLMMPDAARKHKVPPSFPSTPAKPAPSAGGTPAGPAAPTTAPATPAPATPTQP